MSEWMFQQAITHGAFWLRRPDRDWFLILECFDIDVANRPGGWVQCNLTLRPDDHWARLVYWRLVHGAASDRTGQPHRSSGVGIL